MHLIRNGIITTACSATLLLSGCFSSSKPKPADNGFAIQAAAVEPSNDQLFVQQTRCPRTRSRLPRRGVSRKNQSQRFR